MLKDNIVRFDSAITARVQRWPRWLKTPMLVVTNTGQPVVMGLAGIIVVVLALRDGNVALAASMAAGIAAMGLNGILKHYIHRTRPDTLYVSNMYFKTSSFPSGHAFGAAVMCGLLAYVSLHYINGPGGYWAAGGLGAFALAVGVSRVYVGAHFPTDVLAGWLLGGLAALVIVVAAQPL